MGFLDKIFGKKEKKGDFITGSSSGKEQHSQNQNVEKRDFLTTNYSTYRGYANSSSVEKDVSGKYPDNYYGKVDLKKTDKEVLLYFNKNKEVFAKRIIPIIDFAKGGRFSG